MRKVFGAVCGVGTVSGLLYGAHLVSNDVGLQRSVEFWREVFPIYLQYRMVQFRNESLGTLTDEAAAEEYSGLHTLHTDHVKMMTYKLGGFYLKSAQVVSVMDGFVPPAFMKWMKDTQDKVPSSFKNHDELKSYVTKILREELNEEFDEVFSEFHETPLGIASIGQVHKAVLRRTGEVVAVKIQLPDMEKYFRADVATLKSFCELALPQFVLTFQEIEKQFSTEFDYVGEANNLNTIRSYIMPKWSHAVSIPKPHMPLCSRHILVMEFLDGVKLVNGIRSQYERVAAATGTSLEAIEKERVESMKTGSLRLLTLEESAASTESLKRQLYWWDMCTSLNVLRHINNWTPLRLVFGPLEPYSTPTPLDLSHILKLLCDVHAYEIFECGCFNGDPHPGNILLLKDGRLGLIDYGQVKTLPDEHRIRYANFILALNNNDEKEIVRIYNKEMGIQTKNNLDDVLYRHAVFYHDREAEDIMQGLNMHLFLEKLEKDDPIKHISEEYVLVGRVNLLLRGMAKAFGLNLRMSELWRAQAEAYLKTKSNK